MYMKRCWDWEQAASFGVCFYCRRCAGVPYKANPSTSVWFWENDGFRLTLFYISSYPRIWAPPGWHTLHTSGLIKKKPKKGEGICHSPRWRKHRDFYHRTRQYILVLWNSTGTLQVWGSSLKFQYCWAERLCRNLQPEEMGWLCGIHFMWNTLQTLPFRTIIAFLRTIMYYVRCIIYSRGYRFIKESWANCQVIIWTVVMSNNKGYNLHLYSVFKLMSYPVWNPALGFLFLCFLIFMNTA